MRGALSPKQLAQAVGLSESSLKRWADEGLIRVARTPGGHRRIPITEAIRFVRERHLPVVRPDILGLPEIAAGSGKGEANVTDAARLLAYLTAGKAPAARGLLTSLYLSGHSIAEVLDGPVREAMEQLGTLWKYGEDGVLREHQATDICIQAIELLRVLISTDQDAPVAAGGAPPGDPYLIPSLAAATVLAAEGFRTINLGPDTPFEALAAAAREHRPALVWLAISYVRDTKQLARGAAALADELNDSGVRLVIGGSRRGEVALPTNSNVYIGASMGELAAYAKGLFAAINPNPSDAEST
jgi:excisionase family DNA binding protein